MHTLEIFSVNERICLDYLHTLPFVEGTEHLHGVCVVLESVSRGY